MSPQLITAIKERIALGKTREEIESEIMSAGYIKEQFNTAYLTATVPSTETTVGFANTEDSTQTPSATLITISDLVRAMWSLMKQQHLVLGKTIVASLLQLLVVVILGGAVFYIAEETISLGILIVVGYFTRS